METLAKVDPTGSEALVIVNKPADLAKKSGNVRKPATCQRTDTTPPKYPERRFSEQCSFYSLFQLNHNRVKHAPEYEQAQVDRMTRT